jgi:hypothetical protein
MVLAMEYLLFRFNFSIILTISLLVMKENLKDTHIHTMTLKMQEKTYITHLVLLLHIRAALFTLQLKHIAIV